MSGSTTPPPEIDRPALRTPKLNPARSRRPTPGSKYYAGFGPGFVADLIDHLNLPHGDGGLLDPWNGAGTTTMVATNHGLAATGFDINPALVTVGKSKLLGVDAVESLDALTHDILGKARSRYLRVTADEPLMQWFTAGTANYLRKIERGIHALLVTPTGMTDFSTASGMEQMSPLAASFYVVMFETVRSFLGSYLSTNPTWFKVSKDIQNVSVSKDVIDARFRDLERRHHAHLLEFASTEASERRAVIKLGNSTDLPLQDSAVDGCITSPPYCTRIDYAVLTRPELAVLGIGNGVTLRSLRDATIGTTTMNPVEPTIDARWGDYTTSLLTRIMKHPSKASAGYYRKFYAQYFDSMYRSLAELRRVVRDDGPTALVVQDSYYKEVHVDLARSLTEMAERIGWTSVEQIDFEVPHVMTRMQPESRRYRTSVTATESLIVLTASNRSDRGADVGPPAVVGS